jgi:hypothetical protein
MPGHYNVCQDASCDMQAKTNERQLQAWHLGARVANRYSFNERMRFCKCSHLYCQVRPKAALGGAEDACEEVYRQTG